MLRDLSIEECIFVSGGTDESSPPPSMEDDIERPRVITEDDIDGDGIPNWLDDPIIVSGDRMTPGQQEAYDYHREVATWTVNLAYYGLLARLGYAGYAGSAGAVGAVGSDVLGDAREQLIDNNAELNYRRDGADGTYDGNVDPGYITGDRTLPQ